MNTSIIYIFSAIGLLDTLYLLYHKIRKTDVACPFFPKEWCKKVQYSKYSKTLGIPNPLAGMLMYGAIFTLTALADNGIINFIPVVSIITVGFLFSLYFTYIQAYVLKAFCTWCVLSAVNFTVMFILILL